MRRIVGLLAFLATAVSCLNFTYQCKGKEAVGASFPENLLPLVYLADIRSSISNGHSQENVSFFQEKRFAEQLWVKEIMRNKTNIIGIGQINVTFDGTNCGAVTGKSPNKPIYALDEFSKKVLNFDGMSLRQLLEEIRRVFKQNSFSASVTYGDIEAVKWTGCRNISGDNIALQVEVIFAGNGTKQPFSPLMKNPSLLAIHILPFNVSTDPELAASVTFDITKLQNPEFVGNELPPGT